MSDAAKAPAIPAPAATILLLRDGADGLEVFMQQRFVSTERVDQFGGALIFPGGKIEAQDRDPLLRDYSRAPDGLDEFRFALRVGAIREAFEECGVLLARPRGEQRLIDGARLAALAGWRERLNAGEIAFAELLRSEELELACDLLALYAHWITPLKAPKRFDTYFFLAPAPADHQLLHDGRESTDSRWITVDAALRGGREQRYNIVFPTQCNLEKLGRSGSVAQALDTAAQSTVVTVQPRFDKRADGVFVVIPPEADYPNCEDRVR